MSDLLKTLAAKLPAGLQTELKRLHFAQQIKRDRFTADEPEYDILDQYIKPGDWVLDIGANVGHYTKRLSELVGKNGRVMAFEPVPTTFSILASNLQRFKHQNVTLLNVAVSERADIVGMQIPEFSSGLDNFYMAHVSSPGASNLSVLSIDIDSLNFDKPIALIKIDVEGHEASALAGLKRTIETYKPVLIVETGSEDIIQMLANVGYSHRHLDNSPNIVFTPDS